MITNWINKNRKTIIYGLYLILIVSIFYSKFVLSLSMMGLILMALVDFSNGLALNPIWKNAERTISRHKSLLSLCLVFVIVALTLFHSENVNDLFWQLKLKLPFLLLPLAFIALPPLNKGQYYGLYAFFIVLISLSSLGVLINYLINSGAINEAISKGQSIPTPIDHIKFSLSVAIAIVAGVVMIVEKITIRFAWERPILIGLTAFLFVFIHVLSVRSGLATLYVALIVLALRYMTLAKNKKPYAIALIILFASPYLAYKVIPSFQSKINYVLWDLKMHKEGKGENYSDSGRLRSIKMGWDVAKISPILGVGFGDIRDVSKQRFIEKYGYNAPSFLPHNQYLTVFAASGIVGLALFLLGILWPLWYNRAYRDHAFLGFSVIILISFLVENTIERSYSIGLYLIFTLAAIHYVNSFLSVDSEA